MRVLIINGPNLNKLGSRDEKFYGTKSYKEIMDEAISFGIDNGMTVDVYQSNIEGEIVDKIQSSADYDAFIINAGAYSHYSIAILDAIIDSKVPTIEVHLSNIYAREEERNKSVISKGCIGVIAGFSHNSYILALEALKK